MTEDTVPAPLPDGDYAIAEILGHRTIVGRYAEVDRFGTKMLAIEPLFDGQLLDTVFIGGASIYQLTPCTADIAAKQQPRHRYQLPASVAVIVPPSVVPAPVVEQEDEDADEEPF